MAVAVDVGIVATTLAGVVGLAGHFLAVLREVNSIIGLSILVVVGYVVATRRAAGSTLGEGLFVVTYTAAARRRAAEEPTRASVLRP